MITGVAVAFIGGKRYLTVSIDGASAGSMVVDDPRHCAELLKILWPCPVDLTATDHWEMATRGGGISIASTTLGTPLSG